MKTIACLGSGSGSPGEPMYDAMVEVGKLLAQRGCRVATGGFGGAGMEAPARGAKKAGGVTIGYTMRGKKPNGFITNEVPCDYIPIPPRGILTINSIEEQYGRRLGRLLEADAFIIAANGGPGTFVELMAIINLNSKVWKEKPKQFTILNPGSALQGWNMHMCDQLSQWGVFPQEVMSLYATSRTAQQAVDWVCQ